MNTTTSIENLKAANSRHAKRIRALERRIAELSDGAQSASISSGGGSKSYSNFQISELRKEIAEHQAAISRNNARMAGGVGRRVYIGRH